MLRFLKKEMDTKDIFTNVNRSGLIFLVGQLIQINGKQQSVLHKTVDYFVSSQTLPDIIA